MNPSLRLTRELIDQIVFGMENQERTYVLDTEDALVIPLDQASTDEMGVRYLELPEWRSVDGYNLMEQFVVTLHNPIVRGRLRTILASGRGVFRQFKDAIRERREVERLWFAFKERRMRETVVEWYNDLRERDGLERLEWMVSETETDELVESDFAFRLATTEDLELVASLDRDAFNEVYPDLDPATIDLYYAYFRAAAPAPDGPDSTVFVAETHGGDFVGFLWAIVRTRGDASIGFVQQIYVLPEYRGFGIARGLYHTFCRHAHEQRIGDVQLALHGAGLDLEGNFTAYGLVRHATFLRIDVERWYRSELS